MTEAVHDPSAGRSSVPADGFRIIMKTTMLIATMMAQMHPGGVQRSEYPAILPYATVGGWNVLVNMDAGPSCYVLGTYAAGTVMRIGLGEDGRIAVVLANPRWKDLKDGRTYDSTMTFDGRSEWKGPGRYAVEGGVGTMVFRFTDPKFVHNLADAVTLSVKVESRDIARMRLTGAKKALAAMVLCQGDVDAVMRDADAEEGPAEDRGTV